MGTYYMIINAANIQGDWHHSAGPGDTTAALTNDTTTGGSNDDQWGSAVLLMDGPDGLDSVQLYLDSDPEPTAYEDLPEDFGIETMDLWTIPPWISTSLTPVDVQNILQLSSATAIGGGVAKWYWFLCPLPNMYNFMGYGGYTVTGSGVGQPFGDPYLLDSIPCVPTKWNGLLRELMEEGWITLAFDLADVAFAGTYTLYVRLNQFIAPVANITAQPDGWMLTGTYGSYPPPPNPSIAPMLSGLEFGGSATIQILTDASGIYTLTPGLYRDELWQRSGTTATITSFEIPQPFFKTGYIGGR